MCLGSTKARKEWGIVGHGEDLVSNTMVHTQEKIISIDQLIPVRPLLFLDARIDSAPVRVQ